MKDEELRGKFIVFEGLDGSGKDTQTRLLIKKLKEEEVDVKKIDFPQYGKKSAGLVEEYLSGKYGAAKEVGPYASSLFFACDRYDGSFKIKKWLKEGRLVISDRYVGSNVGHQGGKIEDQEKRREYIKWLFNLEYKIFGIPRPDLNIFLKTSCEVGSKMSSRIKDEAKKEKRKKYLGDDKKKDIHEKDLNHLKRAMNSYLWITREYPQEYEMVECLNEKGEFLKPEVIHEKVWRLINKKIKL